MMPNIFSSFDVYESSSSFLSSKITILLLFILLFLSMMSYLWVSNNRKSSCISSPMNIMYMQLSRTNSKYMKGYTIVISTMFLLIIMVNLMGMIPYSFSISTHLLFTLTLGLPLWLTIIMSSFMYSKKQFIGKLLPDGAPDWLNPFLVLIETVSISVRPLTLSFRLGANMSAGHIVLSLLGTYLALAMSSSTISTILLMMISTGYILFEFAICLIQAYIFCLLLSLYTDDHTN
uniref:ATP synthase F0 subunit 6 n=1 Tax=Helobdella europaea TaxID=270691 RepID=UPI0023EF8FB0|nr:ATP synthase F0 subunit 6 [Helobdella europaea]WDY83678.1 ATP synthase F0 subunit 6 [Helobdella europaea]